MVPLFIAWVAACNVAAILMGVLLHLPLLELVVVLGINILSIIMLKPLFGSRPIKPFIPAAAIWFVATAVVYVLFGLYFFLIPATIQALGDVWFNWELKRRVGPAKGDPE